MLIIYSILCYCDSGLMVSTATSPYSDRNKKRSGEVTRVICGVETVVNTVLQFVNQTNDKIDAFIDQTRPSLVINITLLKEAFLDAKKRGVKLRYITEITKDNISYCKELMTIVDELRHIEGIKGNFYISETEYIAPATFHEKGKPASQIIYSDVNEIVEHQRYVFDTLWTRAISAEQRIEQIEGEGVEHEFLQVITNQKKASRTLAGLVKSMEKEALLFLPNDKEMLRLDKLGIIDHIMRRASQGKEVTVKIISPLSEENSEIVNRITKRVPSIRILNADSNSPFGICIIDGEKLLRTEIRQLNTYDFSEAVDFAIYSNRKLTVNSFKSIFELLWNERVLNEQLKVHDKMQKEFINIAAHEVRTPIQAIVGYSELLRTEPESALHFITPILKNAYRLEKLANDILDVTRIENKQLRLNLERFNLCDLVSDIVIDFRNNNTIQSKEGEDNNNSSESKRRLLLQLNYEAEEDNIFVQADRTRIARVISNLLANAIKFTRSGLISVKCHREHQDSESTDNNSQHENAIVNIKDTGSGIAADIFPRLFTKFATNSMSGTGLGLFISKSIIEAHSGKIWAQNNQNGTGATFSFSLPIAFVNDHVLSDKSHADS
jgi:signal transduction histidine kinase